MYADNVLKGFATSFSVIISCIISSWLMESTGINSLFILGAGIVVTSAFVYSVYPASSVAPSLPTTIQSTTAVLNSIDNIQNLNDNDSNK